MWGWLSGIVDFLAGIKEGVQSLLSSLGEKLTAVKDAIFSIPQTVWDFFSGSFTTLWNWLTDIVTNIVELPGKMIELIKEVFVPDPVELQAIYDDLIESLGDIFGIDNYNFDTLFSSGSSPDDVFSSYTIVGHIYDVKFADLSFLRDAVEYFRPYIRGFIVLLLVIFNIRQAFSIFGLSSGEIASAKKEANK